MHSLNAHSERIGELFSARTSQLLTLLTARRTRVGLRTFGGLWSVTINALKNAVYLRFESLPNDVPFVIPREISVKLNEEMPPIIYYYIILFIV